MLGHAGEAITAKIKEEHVDLVVLATHGRHGIDRLLHAGVPVLLLHGGATAPEGTTTGDDSPTIQDASAE
jgi:hypothetical protein